MATITFPPGMRMLFNSDTWADYGETLFLLLSHCFYVGFTRVVEPVIEIDAINKGRSFALF